MPRISERLRDEDGFTLIELLLGLVLGTVIMMAAFLATDAASKLSTGTAMRIDSVARARNGMERITRSVRAQQCNSGATPMLWASNTGMEFYASIAPNGQYMTTPTKQPLERHHIEWKVKTGATDISNGGKPIGDIVETVYRQTQASMSTTTPVWPATPTSITTLAQDVEQAPDRRNPNALVPFFRYYKYQLAPGSAHIDVTDPVDMVTGAASIYNPAALASASGGDLAGIVVIEISMRSTPRKNNLLGGAPRTNTDLYNTVSVRIADPTKTPGSSLCI